MCICDNLTADRFGSLASQSIWPQFELESELTEAQTLLLSYHAQGRSHIHIAAGANHKILVGVETTENGKWKDI